MANGKDALIEALQKENEQLIEKLQQWQQVKHADRGLELNQAIQQIRKLKLKCLQLQQQLDS